MSSWEEYAKKGKFLEWPYPVRYDVENQISADVLVLGGGIAGCWAAISARRKGVKVVLVEKGATSASGAGGAGVDNWNYTPNPCSKITPDECVEAELAISGGYTNGISRYITAMESYDTLVEMEQMGGKIRDTEGEFEGAEFRDEDTGFCFRFDYVNKLHFVVWGANFKSILYKECKRLGVIIYDRVQVTSLLSEGGKQGARIVGATGLNNRTGEFYIFQSKATIDCMSRHSMNWLLSLQEARVLDAHRPYTVTGNGHAMAWRAGAELAQMERSKSDMTGAPSFPAYGQGSSYTSWFPCSIVDANGKEIPWIDCNGNVLKNVEERSRPVSGQKFVGERGTVYAYKRPELVPNIIEMIKKGDFKLPLYADLPGMPEMERKLIWGVMIGNEGKTKIPVWETYTEAGFNPDRDMLQNYEIFEGRISSVAQGGEGAGISRYRISGELGEAGGLMVDWNLMTTLDGLFAAGDALFAANYHHHAATTGRYAGRKAAEYAQEAGNSAIVQSQVEAEKNRIYAPVKRTEGIDWKEIRSAGARVMQNYCGQSKSEELLNIGLLWLKDIEESELTRAYAGDPHKLGRTIDSFDIITCSEIILNACLVRRASSKILGFDRLDYPEVDPPEWHKWITIKLEQGKVKDRQLPINFWGDFTTKYDETNRDYQGWRNS